MKQRLATLRSSSRGLPLSWRRSLPLVTLLIGVLVFGVLGLGFFKTPSALAQSSQATAEAEGEIDLQRLQQAIDIVQSIYVEDVSKTDLIESAIEGMLSDLDPHSAYLSPEALTALTEGVSGNFGGLGIQIDMFQDVVRVIAPIDNTPAFRAGLKAGDLITELDGEPVFGKTLDEAVNIMRGEIGTEITLRVVREATGESFDVTIERGTIPEISVLSRLEADNVGFIRISNFSARTGAELDEAVDGLIRDAQTPLAGFIIDLRNNPGGALSGAIAVSDAFLDAGQIVSTRKRDGQVDQNFSARRGDITAGLPLVVLIDGGSASASEIVAAALQANGRAIIMGQRSFGKGSVQEIYRLGPDAGLKLTVARYYSPDGTSIQGVGVIPDIEVRPATIEYLDSEPAYREENLGNALSGDTATEEAETETKDEGEDEATEANAKEPSPTHGLEDRPELGEAIRPEFETTDEDGDGLSEQLLDYPLERAIDLIQALSLTKALND